MSLLPPLTEKFAPGAPGGHEFEHLVNQLLLRHADQHRFEYVPVGTRGRDGGADGLAPKGGVPGFEGTVVFQFKWLRDGIHKGDNARQVKESLQRAITFHPEMRHWVLV